MVNRMVYVCRELSDLHKVTAVNQSVAHEAVLSAEQSARQELTEAVEKQRVEHHREKEQLLLEVCAYTRALSLEKKVVLSAVELFAFALL